MWLLWKRVPKIPKILSHATFQTIWIFPSQIFLKEMSKHKIDPIFEVFNKKMFELMCYTWLYDEVDDTSFNTIAPTDVDDKCFFVKVS